MSPIHTEPIEKKFMAKDTNRLHWNFYLIQSPSRAHEATVKRKNSLLTGRKKPPSEPEPEPEPGRAAICLHQLGVDDKSDCNVLSDQHTNTLKCGRNQEFSKYSKNFTLQKSPRVPTITITHVITWPISCFSFGRINMENTFCLVLFMFSSSNFYFRLATTALRKRCAT